MYGCRGLGIDQAGVPKPVEVMDDGSGRQAETVGQLLDGHRPGGQQPDDAQPRRVGEGLKDEQQIVVHGGGSMHDDLMAVKSRSAWVSWRPSSSSPRDELDSHMV